MRFAHLTDTHINGTVDRRQRLLTALDRARASGAHHLLLTGDLTANGHPTEFEELGSILNAWPHDATIVGGNHDGAGFVGALPGPLGRFHGSSTTVLNFGVAMVVPLNTYFPNRGLVFRAMGRVGQAQISLLQTVLATSHVPVVVAMHHGPQRDPLRHLTGLVDGYRLQRLLDSNGRVHICCGHDHRLIDLQQVHVAASVAHHPDPLRLYDIVNGCFAVSYRSRCQGKYFGDAVCEL